MAEKRKRLLYLDYVSAFFIIQIIIGHILQFVNIYSVMDSWVKIFSFYMPFFYFKSGMFANTDVLYRNHLKANTNKLLIPFLIMSLIGYVLNLPFELVNTSKPLYEILLRPWGSLLKHGSMPSSLALWFLLSLFEVKLCFNLIIKSRYKITILLLFFIISIIVAHKRILLPLCLSTLFPGVLIYFMGYVYNNYSSKYSWGLAITAMLVFANVAIWDDSVVEMRNNFLSEGHYITWFIKSISGIISLNFIAYKLPSLHFLGKIGKDSMGYYIYHWILLILIWNLLSSFYSNFTSGLFIVVSCVVCIVVLPLLVYYSKIYCPIILGSYKNESIHIS